MPKAISKAKIDELSLVFGDFAPRNPNATVLAVKAQPSLIGRFADALKKAGVWPVSADVEDGIDNDGDGSDDYNEIVSLLCSVFYDLQASFGIGDDKARSMAIKVAIDGFKEAFLACCDGKDVDKAGKRHSAADQERLDKIGASLAEAKKNLEAASEAHAAMMPAQNDDTKDGGPDDPEDADAEGKAAKKDEKPEGDYGSHEEAGYADPGYQEDKKPRYPLKKDGELDKERVKAAWDYIHKEKDAAAYSAEDLAKIKDRIRAAAKEVGVEIADDKAGPVETTVKLDVTADGGVLERFTADIAAMLEKAQAEIKADVAAVAEKSASLEDVKALLDEHDAKIDEKLAAAQKAAAESRKSLLSEAVDLAKAARKASAPGGSTPIASAAPTVPEIKPETSTIADVLQASRAKAQTA